jgi:hypothetical protein
MDELARHRAIFGVGNLGYPINRRPDEFRRLINRQAITSDVDHWVKSQYTEFLNKKGISRKERDTARRVLYTWRHVFFEKVSNIPATDLLIHYIPTYPDAIPRAAKLLAYNLEEKQ